jgi:hypothetical protein
MPRKRHRRQLLVTDLDPEWVAAAVRLRADPQARLGGGRADQLDEHLVACQGPATPAHRDRAEQLQPVGAERTRLLIRTRGNYAPWLLGPVMPALGLFDATYGRAQLRAIARRAEALATMPATAGG